MINEQWVMSVTTSVGASWPCEEILYRMTHNANNKAVIKALYKNNFYSSWPRSRFGRVYFDIFVRRGFPTTDSAY